ncbi:hypothetical protein Tco_1336949 [Tanacetum coccineum]
MDEELRESCRTLEKCLFHKGRIVTPSFISENNMLPFFQIVGLEPFLTLNEPICPRFVVEFYHNLKVKRDEELRPYIEFKLGQFTFKLTLSQLSQILKTPHVLETFYTTEWLLNSLDDHPKRNYFGLKHDLIKKAITTPRTTQAQLLRDPNKLYVDDIHPDLKGWELFFKENFFCSTNKRNKGNKIASPLIISSSSSSSDDNKAPYFLEFYDELSDSEDLTKAQLEKRGMFKMLEPLCCHHHQIHGKAKMIMLVLCLNVLVKTVRMSVKYPNYVNLTSSSEEQPNERTPLPPPRKKSLSPPQAPSKSISSKSTHYTSSSSPSESPTPTHVTPPPKLCFVITIKLEPQELPPPQITTRI